MPNDPAAFQSCAGGSVQRQAVGAIAERFARLDPEAIDQDALVSTARRAPACAASSPIVPASAPQRIGAPVHQSARDAIARHNTGGIGSPVRDPSKGGARHAGSENKIAPRCDHCRRKARRGIINIHCAMRRADQRHRHPR
ncbi:MAG: hypothetical protein R3F11_20015 [Verrucomicrobiales bacterium]